MSDEARFNWQEEPHDSFRHWMLTSLLASNQINELSEATSRFTDVRVSIAVNGVAMDADKFLDRLDSAVESAIGRGVAERIESFAPLADLEKAVSDWSRAIKSELKAKARAAGYELDEEEW